MTPYLISKGFIVQFKGDKSVGIPDSIWNITGEFLFDTQEDYNSFRMGILQSFEFCSDTPLSIRPIEAIEAEEEKLMKELETEQWIKADKPIEEYPLGTKAKALMGGYWIRVKLGWKWCTGSTFPRPGGDWTGEVCLPESL